MLDPIVSTLGAFGGSIAGRTLDRPSKRIAVNEDWDSFGNTFPRTFFAAVDSPQDLTHLEDRGHATSNSKPYRWIKQNNGYDIAFTSFQFTLHAHKGTVDIVGAEPLVQKVSGRPGIALVKPPIGGPLHFRHISVDLDAATYEHRNLGDEVTVRDLENPTARVTQLAASLAPGETQNFHVVGVANEHSVEWALLLKLRVNGKAAEEIVRREDGQPFVTLSRNDPNITARYEFTGGQWIYQG